MDNHDGHKPKITISVEINTVCCWLQGGVNQEAAVEDVADSCFRWLSFHSRGLPRRILKEIVEFAMAEAYSAFHTENLSIDDALIRLQRALNRLRQREDTLRQREFPLDERSADRPDSRNVYQEIIEQDFWQHVVRLIDRHMTGAFLCLSPNDQNLLSGFYGLEEIGDPISKSDPPSFPSTDAKKKALFRARRRFSEHLESLLEEELNIVRKHDRPLYEAALRLVKGGKLRRVLAAVSHKVRKGR